jgi:hypothetical protein
VISAFILFVIGFLVFLDAIMPSDRMMYVATTVFFLILGFLTAFFSSVSSMQLALFLLILVVGIVVYLDRIRKMHRAIRK